MKLRNIAFITCSLFFVGFLFASDQTTKVSMKSDLDFIRNSFEVYYAPKEWKYKYTQWDLNEEIKKAKDKVDSEKNITTKKYQQIVKEFFQSTKDYHVGVYFHSTESASLPLVIQGTEGRYFIVKLDTNYLPLEAWALNPGDEVISIDNRPVKEVVKELMSKETAHSNEATDEALAAYYLTHRIASKGHTVPNGYVTLQVKPKGSSTTGKYKLKWNYNPERILNSFEGELAALMKEDSLVAKIKRLDRKMIMADFAQPRQEAEEDDMGLLAQRKSFIPLLGSKILFTSQNSSHFHAYIYETAKGNKIGYIRIPTYDCGDEEFEQFATLIAYLEKTTDGLVIDQVNNPGGSVTYFLKLLSVLSNTPMKTPTQRVMITQEEVNTALELVDLLSLIVNNPSYLEGLNFPFSLAQTKLLLNYYNFIVAEWSQGRSFTKKFPLMGFDTIPPDAVKTKYTRPILVLVNSLDFSSADFFPAILQDNKRAKIMGSRTAGAGGSVDTVKFPNRFGINYFSYTTSIAERLNSKPIENLGITPDIEYNLNVEDYQNNYKGYVQAINNAIEGLIKKK